MRRTIFLTAFFAALLSVTAAAAQESYSYTVTHTRTLRINWKPDVKTVQRYTVAVNPWYGFNNGFKFDFEYELPKPGQWLQTSLISYIAPSRDRRNWGWYDDNNRWTFNSSFDDYRSMWGIGTSLLYKNTFSRRGWYFSTGLVLEFFRVGKMGDVYFPYKEDGLTFYDRRNAVVTRSYLKPTAQINFGKHFAVSRRCFFDLYLGFDLSYSIYDRDKAFHDEYGYNYYSTIYGFAYRGFSPHGGFRFGVLLWDKK